MLSFSKGVNSLVPILSIIVHSASNPLFPASALRLHGVPRMKSINPFRSSDRREGVNGFTASDRCGMRLVKMRR